MKTKISLTNVLALCLGTMLEWAEYTCYAYLSPFFIEYFFPQEDLQAAQIFYWMIFASGMLMRPIGSLLFAKLASIIGRTLALFYSLLLMAISTVLIGVLPTFQQIGLAAPLLLMFFRLLQGLSIAGEYNGAAIYLYETAPITHKARRTSLIPLCASVGMLFGSGLCQISQFIFSSQIGWRMPFIFSGSLFLILATIRNNNYLVSLTDVKSTHHLENNILTSLRRYINNKKLLLWSIFAAATIGLNSYICHSFLPLFMVSKNWDYDIAIKTATIGQCICALLIPLLSYFVDKFKYQHISYAFSVALITPLIIFNQVQFANSTLSSLFIAFLFGFTQAYLAITVMTEMNSLFLSKDRYNCIPFLWSLGIVLIAAHGPSLATYLKVYFANDIVPGMIVSSIALLSLVLYPKEFRYIENSINE